MYTQADKNPAKKNTVTTAVSGKQSANAFPDNRPETFAQLKLQEMASDSSQARDVAQLHAKTGTANGVVQLVRKTIGLPEDAVTDRYAVVREIRAGNDTLSWPGKGQEAAFSGHYGGSVSRALNWGLTTVEGTAGWTTREYAPQDFHRLANQAFSATRKLTEPALNNESNKTLIAIRTFRSNGEEHDMAAQTLQDLQTILEKVNAAREELVMEGLIPDASDTVERIKADPAEAHPNTLPTAKITFATGNTVYFKGRSGKVESAFAGTGRSSGSAISGIGPRQKGDEVGLHSFVSKKKTHITEDVRGRAFTGKATPEKVIAACVGAARTAALVLLTGTGDLHSSNVLEGGDGRKHVIDAEFLLDLTTWMLYEDSLRISQVPNFEIGEMVPEWALNYFREMDTEERKKLVEEVVQSFLALRLDREEVQETVLAPIRRLAGEQKTLLRISPQPFDTASWLRSIGEFQTSDNPNAYVESKWKSLKRNYREHYKVRLFNKNGVIDELKSNFSRGQVPLFHIEAHSRLVYLNKEIVIGEISEERSVDRFLDLTKLVFRTRYEEMTEEIRKALL